MIAKGLATNGARVYVSGRRLDRLQDASKTIVSGSGSFHLYVYAFVENVLSQVERQLSSDERLVMDVNDEESIKKGVEVIEKAEGKLDILVNK